MCVFDIIDMDIPLLAILIVTTFNSIFLCENSKLAIYTSNGLGSVQTILILLKAEKNKDEKVD